VRRPTPPWQRLPWRRTDWLVAYARLWWTPLHPGALLEGGTRRAEAAARWVAEAALGGAAEGAVVGAMTVALVGLEACAVWARGARVVGRRRGHSGACWRPKPRR